MYTRNKFIFFAVLACVSCVEPAMAETMTINFETASCAEVSVFTSRYFGEGYRFTGSEKKRERSMKKFADALLRCGNHGNRYEGDESRNVGARQRYIINNQTGNYPFRRTPETLGSERQIDRYNAQIRAAQGEAAARQRMREASACLMSAKNCR
jgi:hypothetical protein